MKPKVILVVVLIVAVIVCAVGWVLDDRFDAIKAWEESYRTANPDATDEEVDAAFRAGIEAMAQWKEQYKADHPGVTDAEADAALKAALEKF